LVLPINCNTTLGPNPSKQTKKQTKISTLEVVEGTFKPAKGFIMVKDWNGEQCSMLLFLFNVIQQVRSV
jgi:hypothetical protein